MGQRLDPVQQKRIPTRSRQLPERRFESFQLVSGIRRQLIPHLQDTAIQSILGIHVESGTRELQGRRVYHQGFLTSK